jgi:cysteine desulfurase
VAAVVLEAMTTSFGNANSVEHLYGEAAADLVEEAKVAVADLVGGDAEGVYFTSGATESIGLAIRHSLSTCQRKPMRVVISSVEHHAVLDAMAFYEQQEDVVIQRIPVDRRARLDMTALKAACRDGVDLVCVMAANNEVGTIYPIRDVVQTACDAGARSLIDATQAVGRIPINIYEWGITYLTVSGHKIYGPKGVGALVVPLQLINCPLGATSFGIGVGTPNVPGIVGLGKACQLRHLEMDVDEPRMAAQRDRLEEILVANINSLVVNGDPEHRLCNNLHVSVPGVPSGAVISRLWRYVSLSSGAACSSGTQDPSHVLQAMGLPEGLIEGALRIGIGKFTSDDEIERAGRYIVDAVSSARSALEG